MIGYIPLLYKLYQVFWEDIEFNTFVKSFIPSTLVAKAPDSQFRGPMFKTTGWLQVDSAFHPSKVNKMNTRNFWKLNGKK